MSSDPNLKLSPSTIRLIKHEHGFDNPRDAMRKLAHGLLVQTGQTSPPIQFGPIFKLRKIRRHSAFGDLDLRRKGLRDACLIPINDGFDLRFRSSRPLVSRVRFSKAHEIGHTFFFDVHSNPPRKLSMWRGRTSDEEKLCDIFAAELLMPEEMVRHFVGEGAKLSLVGLVDLSRKFETSYEAMSRRVVQDLELWRAIVLGVCWLPKKDTEDTKDFPSEKWRLVWYVLPPHLEGIAYVPDARNRPSLNQVLAQRVFSEAALDDKASNHKLRLGNLDTLVARKQDTERCHLEALVLKPRTLSLSQTNEVQDRKIRKETEILIAIELL